MDSLENMDQASSAGARVTVSSSEDACEMSLTLESGFTVRTDKKSGHEMTRIRKKLTSRSAYNRIKTCDLQIISPSSVRKKERDWMCGRYSLFTEEENQEIMRIVRSLDAKYPGNQMKRGEIYPTNTAPILCLDHENIKPELSLWGFPRFGTAKGIIINARSESADERPMFKKSLHSRRCVVPSTGFYEWTHNESKTKYQFRLPGSNVLYMAGIYNEFKGESRFVILTTGANSSIADVHERMPVILQNQMVEDWIMSEEFALSYLHANMPVLRREAVL